MTSAGSGASTTSHLPARRANKITHIPRIRISHLDLLYGLSIGSGASRFGSSCDEVPCAGVRLHSFTVLEFSVTAHTRITHDYLLCRRCVYRSTEEQNKSKAGTRRNHRHGVCWPSVGAA